MRSERTNRRRVAWGVILIALGAFLLLLQLDTFSWVHWGVWWPAILVAIGLIRILTPEHPRHIASGASMVLLGLWFFACTNHWYELTYRRAWPLLLVIFGFEIVFKAVLDRLGPAKEEEERHA